MGREADPSPAQHISERRSSKKTNFASSQSRRTSRPSARRRGQGAPSPLVVDHFCRTKAGQASASVAAFDDTQQKQQPQELQRPTQQPPCASLTVSLRRSASRKSCPTNLPSSGMARRLSINPSKPPEKRDHAGERLRRLSTLAPPPLPPATAAASNKQHSTDCVESRRSSNSTICLSQCASCRDDESGRIEDDGAGRGAKGGGGGGGKGRGVVSLPSQQPKRAFEEVPDISTAQHVSVAAVDSPRAEQNILRTIDLLRDQHASLRASSPTTR